SVPADGLDTKPVACAGWSTPRITCADTPAREHATRTTNTATRRARGRTGESGLRVIGPLAFAPQCRTALPDRQWMAPAFRLIRACAAKSQQNHDEGPGQFRRCSGRGPAGTGRAE